MFVVRSYTQPTYAALSKSSSQSMSAGSGVWEDVLGGWTALGNELPNLTPEFEMVDGHKAQVRGGGAYVLTALGAFNNTNCSIRIVRNSTANVLATGPASAFSAYQSAIGATPVQLEDGDLIWMQMSRSTTLSRSFSGGNFELAPA